MRPTKQQLQHAGETLAAQHLLDEGFDSVETNVRLGHLELDVVAERGGELVVCEVRTRSSSFVHPLCTIDKKKAARVLRAAERVLRSRPHIESVRVDVAGVRLVNGRYQMDYVRSALSAF